MDDVITWAIVDAAAEPEVFTMLEALDPPHTCLYAEPVTEEILNVAPFLILATQDVLTWLKLRRPPWGILLESQANMITLRQHLRKYLHVLLPGDKTPVYFRFYDPRNIRPLISVLSPWELHTFLGPINAITTHWQGEECREHFTELRKTFHSQSGSRRKMLQISQAQMDKLTEIFNQRYVETLVGKINSWSASDREPANTEATGEIFNWLKQQGIDDERSILGLFLLFHQRGYLTLATLPPEYRTVLNDPNESGVFKAESLLLREMGCLPQV
ncbi:hypothetical protein M942_24295 [Enterobacter ludwigii]|uniref:DUF4123 domain-containing protein n=1 Tax=Enterobacter ludwigii TaxID=299767 RepID=UPI0003D7D96F|nr:DUF4123 domain-containing protein [Enterobacter ludwigii]AHE73528.1 hypothetical protein M942_24295 [Enterobacter ludwigii]